MSRPLIAVVRGGYSGESVISHQSAARMLGAIDGARYEALYVTVERENWSCSDAGEKPITYDRGSFAVVRGKGIEPSVTSCPA